MGKKVKVSLETAKKIIISEILADISSDSPNKHFNTVYLEGTMGIGKSSIFRQIVSFMSNLFDEEWGLCDLRFATLSASDIQGIPHPVKQEDGTYTMQWIKDATLPGIDHKLPKHGLILMDEINQVKEPAVKSIMYQFILDRKINDYTLPEGWYQGCAGNREEDGGIYDRLLAPVRDRMMILEVDVNPTETLDYFEKSKFHPAVLDYLRYNIGAGVNVLHTYDPELEMSGDEECLNYVFCTPRTYEFVSNVLYDHERLLKIGVPATQYVATNEVLKAKLCGLMGENDGKRFFERYNTQSKFDITSIIKANWSDNKPDIKVPTREDVGNFGSDSADIVMYIINTAATGDAKTKMAILKWLVWANAPKQTISNVYSNLSYNDAINLKSELIKTNCTNLLEELSDTDNKITI